MSENDLFQHYSTCADTPCIYLLIILMIVVTDVPDNLIQALIAYTVLILIIYNLKKDRYM